MRKAINTNSPDVASPADTSNPPTTGSAVRRSAPSSTETADAIHALVEEVLHAQNDYHGAIAHWTVNGHTADNFAKAEEKRITMERIQKAVEAQLLEMCTASGAVDDVPILNKVQKNALYRVARMRCNAKQRSLLMAQLESMGLISWADAGIIGWQVTTYGATINNKLLRQDKRAAGK